MAAAYASQKVPSTNRQDGINNNNARSDKVLFAGSMQAQKKSSSSTTTTAITGAQSYFTFKDIPILQEAGKEGSSHHLTDREGYSAGSNSNIDVKLQPAESAISSKAKGALNLLSDFAPNPAEVERLKASSHSSPLPESVVSEWSSSVPGVVRNPFLTTYLHNDYKSDLVTAAYDAEAVTIGNHIFLGAEAKKVPGLLAHELSHVAQSAIYKDSSSSHLVSSHDTLEKEAYQAQNHFLSRLPIVIEHAGSPFEPMFHPAISVLKRAGRWLAKKTVATISKHIARHGRRIAGRAAHSVFKNPREIKTLVTKTVKEGEGLAERAVTHGADDILEEGGVRVFRQGTGTPGKHRFVAEKDFGRQIGTRGETILRVVIDMSGRIVTAFPVDRFLIMGLGVVASDIFTARTAEAAESIRSAIEAEENKEMSWPEAIIDFIFAPSVANEGEDLMLEIDRTVHQTTIDVINEIEETEGILLDEDERQAIADLVAEAIGNPMVLEEETTAEE